MDQPHKTMPQAIKNIEQSELHGYRAEQGTHDRGVQPINVGNVPDSLQQESVAAKDALAQNPGLKKLNLNEGGRSHQSDDKGNPPGAVHGLPKPSMRETGH
jgi:hypothetical protein